MSTQSEDPQQATAIENAPGKPAFFGVPPDLARADLEKTVADAAKKFGFANGGPATPPGSEEQAPENDADLLRRLLADQRAATIQAQADALNLQKLLEETKARAAKTTGQMGVVPVRLEDASGRLRPDAVLIKAQWERAKKDLQRSLVARTRESEQAKAKLEAVSEALRHATEESERESERFKRQFRFRIQALVGAACVTLAATFAVISYWPHPKAVIERATPALLTSPRASLPDTKVSPAGPVQDAGTPEPALAGRAENADVTQQISRLSRAFSRFPGVDPEVVVRAVNKRAPASSLTPCAFAWNAGEPALQFGDQYGGHSSITASLSRCADAVERFR
jgi:hypothetical protein